MLRVINGVDVLALELGADSWGKAGGFVEG
jgi:hypothetical protein